ncbi:hypothetical protein COOONC_17595 [Cooperia oncophora]
MQEQKIDRGMLNFPYSHSPEQKTTGRPTTLSGKEDGIVTGGVTEKWTMPQEEQEFLPVEKDKNHSKEPLHRHIRRFRMHE